MVTKTKSKAKSIWIIMRVHLWSSMEFTSAPLLPFPIKLEAPNSDSIGFCEIFDDHDKALAAAKDGDMIVPMSAKEVKR